MFVFQSAKRKPASRMLFHLLLLSLRIPGALCALSDFQVPKYSDALSRAVTDIIRGYFVKEANIVNLFQVGDSAEA